MKIELRKLSEIKPYPRNPRQNDQAVDAVAASIQQFGFRQPIVVDEGGVIVVGHTRWKAAMKLGLETVPVHVATGLSPAQIKAYRLADNKTADLAEWDLDLLPIELAELEAADFDLSLIGFSDQELAELFGENVTDGLTDPDEVPEPPDEPITKPGDLWILGDHRLLCGDAGNSSFTNPNKHHQRFDLERHPKKANATHRKMRAKDRPLENDFVSDEQFDQLLHAWFGNVARVLEPGRAFYIWGGYANCANYPPVLNACKLYFSQTIIWVKEHPVLTRKDFMGNHEWCFYGWREGAAHQFLGPNNAVDTWSVKKINPNKMVHLTEKPTELAIRAIQYSSRPGENVLDLFGGSGSTLIAAEQTGRKAFLMELDSLYADVIVERWQSFTGRRGISGPGRPSGNNRGPPTTTCSSARCWPTAAAGRSPGTPSACGSSGPAGRWAPNGPDR